MEKNEYGNLYFILLMLKTVYWDRSIFFNRLKRSVLRFREPLPFLDEFVFFFLGGMTGT